MEGKSEWWPCRASLAISASDGGRAVAMETAAACAPAWNLTLIWRCLSECTAHVAGRIFALLVYSKSGEFPTLACQY